MTAFFSLAGIGGKFVRVWQGRRPRSLGLVSITVRRGKKMAGEKAFTKAEIAECLVMDAQEAWNKAPLHVRTMAGAYVGPILAAMGALAEAVLEKNG